MSRILMSKKWKLIEEPRPERNPQKLSEPIPKRSPFRNSEPNNRRNPCKSSGPSRVRNPSIESEPLRQRNPLLVSEPRKERNPLSYSDWKSSVRALVEIYYDVQDVRIRSFNRLREVGEVRGVEPEILQKLESQIREYVRDTIHDKPIFVTYLSSIKGIGPILGGGLISWLDPYKAPHISSFWKYAGLSVKNGMAEERKTDEKINYNPTVKVLCWKIARNLIMAKNTPYKDIYDEAKIEEAEKLGYSEETPEGCPRFIECSKRLKRAEKPACRLHIDYRARRKMVKRFLSDFWVVWRKLEGLPISEPYAIGMLGHTKS